MKFSFSMISMCARSYVTIIGSGRLVGLPASQWFTAAGAYVSVVTKDTVNISEYTKNADIVVCGAGVPEPP
jgi:5,10-methylene-tetrahydrofolate dehydrogenase/methenyl tetrahydrofolate cyclohydrolase